MKYPKKSEAAKKRQAAIPKDILSKMMSERAANRWANKSPAERKRHSQMMLSKMKR